MKTYQSITQLVGGTPLLELKNYEKEQKLNATILAKLEYLNPAGSVKDRIAKAMIEDAEAKGLLTPESVIIEPTSGNTGIGLAAVAASRGYRIILTMPETMSVERRNLLKAYGAELVLTDGSKGMKGAIARANELAEEIPGSFIPGQFTNASNPKAHRDTTGPEIWQDADGKVDIFVAGVGTGGTLSGVGQYLKSQNPNIKIVAVEPAGFPKELQAPTRSRESAPASFLTLWTPPSTMRSSPWKMKTLSSPGAPSPEKKAYWWESPRVPRSMLLPCWQSARKIKERSSLRCCRIPEIGICPHRCLRSRDFAQEVRASRQLTPGVVEWRYLSKARRISLLLFVERRTQKRGEVRQRGTP